MALGGGNSEAAATRRLHMAQHRYRLPPGSREILLVRHGASVGETVETLQIGKLRISDPPLNVDGKAQAQALARRLAAEPIEHIFITPLRRTRETAAPLAAVLRITPAVIEELREEYLGDWEHTFYTQAAAGHPLLTRMFAEENYEVIPNAESMAEFGARVRKGILRLANWMAEGQSAVALIHGGVIAEICRQATESRPFAFLGSENTSVSRLVIAVDGAWQLRSFNDTSHLDSLNPLEQE